jgi:PmbA protein
VESHYWARQLKDIFDSYELCFVKERTKKYEAADGVLLSLELNEEEGVSLRGIKDGRMAFAYTYEQGEKAAAALIENAKMIMPYLDADPARAFPMAQQPYPDLGLYDDEGLKVADDVKVAALVEMEASIRRSDKRITATRNCELHESEVEIRIINSRGLEAEGKKTLYILSGMAVAADKEDEVSWYEWSWGSRYGDVDGKKLGEKIGEKTLSFLGGQVLDTGTYLGLFPPAAACQLIEVLAPSFLGENLHKGKSRLMGRVGEACFSRLLTIIDSGTKGIDAFPFDGEGVTSQDTILVEDGVLKGFLYDTYYGALFGTSSTGNASRSGIKSPPRCDTRGFFVANGTGDGLGGIEEGLIVEELMGTHTANPVTGEFSVGALGHYWSGGRRVPFKGVILAGNLFDLLSNVRAVGKDLTFFGSHGSPTLLIEGLKISGK